MELRRKLILSFAGIFAFFSLAIFFSASYKITDRLQIGLVLLMMLICGLLLAFFLSNRIEKTLKESDEKYHMLFNSAGDSIIVHDMALRILAMNSVARTRYGYTESELKSMTVNMLNKSGQTLTDEDWLARVEEQGEAHFETVHQSKDGTTVPVDVNAQRIVWDGKQAIISIFRDITGRKEIELSLRESERLLRESQKIAKIGSYEINMTTGRWQGSPGIYEIFGIDETFPHTIEGWRRLVHPDWRKMFMQNLRLVNAEKQRYDYEYQIIRHDNGEPRWVHVLGEVRFEEASDSYWRIGTIQDITERKTAENEIVYLSYHDKLTGLHNRRFYEEAIQQVDDERNLPVSIILADVNGLKLVNDAFGHHKGDELLQKASAAFQSVLRTTDVVARWGGDEFVILLPKTKSEEVETIIKRIKERYVDERVYNLNLSISFGWHTKTKKEEDILKILKIAEDNMYKNKVIENEGIRGNTIGTIIHTLHEKNPREEQHSKRVSRICVSIGKAMGLSGIEINKLKVVGLLHDIGKIAIEESILNKNSALTAQEWDEIKRHPEIGCRILSASYEMGELAECVLAHHERWDGAGYPKRLKGEEIPKIARIIMLADSYDAMISERPYRKALSEERILEEIRNHAGLQFDPEIAEIFVEKVLNRPWQSETDQSMAK